MGLRHRHAKVHRGAFEEDGGGAVVVINPLVGRETLQRLSHFCQLLGCDQSNIGGRMPGIVVELAPRQHGNKEPQTDSSKRLFLIGFLQFARLLNASFENFDQAGG